MSLYNEIGASLKTGQAAAYQKQKKADIKAQKNANQNFNAELSKLTQQQNQQITDITGKQIDGTRQQFQTNYDLNAINEEIQADQIREKMANAGLSDSGLNRSQIMALGTARINADNSVTQQYNHAVSTLRSNLQNAIIENNRTLAGNIAQNNYNAAQTVAGIKSEYNNKIIDRKTQFNYDTKTAVNKVISTIASTSDKAANAQAIFAYAKTYNLSNNSVERLLKLAGISNVDYKKWQKNRDFFKADEVVARSTGSKKSTSSAKKTSKISKPSRTPDELSEKYRLGLYRGVEGQISRIKQLYNKGIITEAEAKAWVKAINKG